MKTDLKLLKEYLQSEIDCGNHKLFIFDENNNATELKTIDGFNAITDLEQENERLKEENKSYQEYPFIIIEKNGVICRKNQEINMIKSRCEKAIEHLKESLDILKGDSDIPIATGNVRNRYLKPVLNILNGSDEK